MDLDSRIEKILNRKNIDNRKKADALLELDASLYVGLGIDTSKSEKMKVKKASRKIYNAIKKVDWQLGCSLLYAMDSNYDKSKEVPRELS